MGLYYDILRAKIKQILVNTVTAKVQNVHDTNVQYINGIEEATEQILREVLKRS